MKLIFQLLFLFLNCFTNTVNADMQVVAGRMDVRSKGIDRWLEQQNAGIDNEIITTINGTIDTVIVHTNGTIVITTTDGTSTTITNQASGGNQNQIINDTSGNSYVVTPNGNVIFISASAGNIIKLALQNIKSTFTSTISILNQSFDNAKNQINQANGLIGSSAAQEQYNQTIIEEESEMLNSNQAQNLTTESTKMNSFKSTLINKRKWFVLNELATYYIDKKSYSELGLINVQNNQMLIQQINQKLTNNESENTIVLYTSGVMQEFVEKIILSRINKTN